MMEIQSQIELRKNRLVPAVDDVVQNLQFLGNLLRENGIKFAFATSGEQALASIASKLPDLILVYTRMPGMDGCEVYKKLKDDTLTKDIPINFLTAKAETDDIVRGFNVGGVDYILKPFNHSELLARVFTHLRDTGQGLDENDINELFKSFKKLSSKPTGGESSTGLGLAIVKKIIDLHGGEIRVKSTKGQGSIFSVSLNMNIK